MGKHKLSYLLILQWLRISMMSVWVTL